MYAVYIFDSVYEYQGAAEEQARLLREDGHSAVVKKLSEQEVKELDI